MSNFPLYDSLSKELSQRDLSVKEKTDFTNKVKDINDAGAELIYALIRVYQMENSEDQSTFKLPFGGKYVKNDMKFDLEQLPNKLKHILYKFLQIHTKTMKEEVAIKETRIEISSPSS